MILVLQVMGSCILLGNRLKQVSQNIHNVLGKKKSLGNTQRSFITVIASSI